MSTNDATRAVLARYRIEQYVYAQIDVDAMASRIAELERDATRLDWIVGKLKVDVLQTMRGTMRPFLVMDRDWPLHPDTPRKSDVRAAIDAAMQEATHD